MSLEEHVAAKDARVAEFCAPVPDRTALLVIDMQRGFIDTGAALEVPRARDIMPRVARLVEVCRTRAVPVIFTQFVYEPTIPCLRGDPFGPEHLPGPNDDPGGFGLPSGNCLIGRTGANSPEVVADLAPRPDEPMIPGHAYNKFHDTPLETILRARDIRYLLITGVTAEICVNDTLTAASTREFRVTAVTDGIAGLSSENEQVYFQSWRAKYARLRITDEVVDEVREFPPPATTDAG